MPCIRIQLNFPAVGVDHHRAASLRTYKAQDQTDQSGFTLAGGTDQRHDLTGLRHQLRPADHLIVLHIGKVQVFHLDGKAPVRIDIQFVAFRNMHFLGQFHQFTDPVSRNGAIQERRNDRGQRFEGTAELASLLQEEGHSVKAERAAPHPVQAVAKGQELNHQTNRGHANIRHN